MFFVAIGKNLHPMSSLSSARFLFDTCTPSWQCQPRSKSRKLTSLLGGSGGGSGILHAERILVGTFCGEMVALADTAENLLVLKLCLHSLVLLIHILNNIACRRELQLDVITNVGRCWVGARAVSLLLSELGPLL